jgi:hypothetical protein
MKRMAVLNNLKYYEFKEKFEHAAFVHPESKKSMEELHYLVEHNLPVRKELLYETCPDIFEYDMIQLDQIERERLLARSPKMIYVS